jgi:choline dehydrogenase-like flavoprotein
MCHQFRDPPQRGRHGGVQIELSANNSGVFERSDEDRSGAQVMERLRDMPNSRGIEIHAESDPGTAKYVALSIDADRFGDPFAHVHYEPSELDRQSYRFVAGLVERFAHATGGELVRMRAEEQFTSGAHHMGTCRMGSTVEDSVVDSFGRVHGVPSLYVAGSAIFAGGSGAVPPTLTLVALALRSAKRILRDLD